MPQLGETCWASGPTPVAGQHKADVRWFKAIWAGKVETSDEHIVLVGERTGKVRAVRRCPGEERWDSALFEKAVATPWGVYGGAPESSAREGTEKRHGSTTAAPEGRQNSAKPARE